jgi:DNA-binding GntR family transcriptional regulator
MAEPNLNLKIEREAESVRERVVRAVREAIASGALAQGRRLTERELVELTGVSRTSVREALRHLQSEGLVEPSVTGLRVAMLTAEHLEHIYEIRASLEPLAVRRFAERASDEALAELTKAFDATLSDDPDEHTRAVYSFYETLLRGCGNPILEDILNSLHTRIHPLRRVSTSLPGRTAAARSERLTLLTAIITRQPQEAAAASLAHVNAAREAALKAIASTPAPRG